MTHTVRLIDATRRAQAKRYVDAAPAGYVMTLREPTRTGDQNARLWAMLTDVADAKPDGRKYTPEVWKALFMHSLGFEQRFLIGLNGEPFPAGFRSSHLSVAQMRDLMDFIEAWCAENGVTLQGSPASMAEGG